MKSTFNPEINVTVLAYEKEGGEYVLKHKRESHNVMTNTGRDWLVRRLGASAFNPSVSHTPHTVQYMGLGCGGALQTDTRFLRTQLELASVLALEDPVPFSLVAGTNYRYLKEVERQTDNATYFPGTGRTLFMVDVLETEVSFSGSTSVGSHTPVDTLVPISEAGLYISSANDEYDAIGNIGVNPTLANGLICYNIFEPIPVTPNSMVRLQWELRC